MNNCSFIGRLCFDPELRYTQSGKAYAKSKIAVDDWNGGEKSAIFLQVIAWEKTAETMAKYTAKGHAVGLVGRLTINEWEDKEGNKRKDPELVVGRLHLLPGNKDIERDDDSRSEAVGAAGDDDYSDLPF